MVVRRHCNRDGVKLPNYGGQKRAAKGHKTGLKAFCEETSLHGFKFAGKRTGLQKRISGIFDPHFSSY